MSSKMKKRVSIISGLIIAAGLIFVIVNFLWGYVNYRMIKKNCPNINFVSEPYPYYDVKTPQDYTLYKYGDISFHIPSDFTLDTDKFKNDNDKYLYKSPDKTEYVMISIMEEKPFKLLVDDDKKYTKKEMEKFFHSMNTEVPSSYYEMEKFILSLTMDNFHMWGKDSAEFTAWAVCKEELLAFRKYYDFQTDQFVGFVHVIREPNEKKNEYSWAVSVWPKSDLNGKYYTILVCSSDLETVQAIVSSIE